MNMEELTKSQIVLLTLLVSFVTSIATGIVTVSLVEQAPPAITQSVSRVIQETVQAVTPPNSQHAAAAATEQKTVVINDSQLISSAVAAVTPTIVRLYDGSQAGATFLGLGVVLDKSGSMAADLSALADQPEIIAVAQSGAWAAASIQVRDSASGIAYLSVASSTSEAAPQWTPVSVDRDHVVLGQAAVALSGKSTPRVASGIVSSLIPLASATTSPQVIDTDIPASSIVPGSILIDTQGALIGISTGVARDASASGFVSASALVR